MKLFPGDWPGFLEELARWGELSIEARRAFLDGMAPGLSVDPATGGAAVAELREAGFLEPAGRGDQLGVAAGRRSVHQVLKSLGRYPLFERAGLAFLSAYLGEHYTSAERSQIHESIALLPNDLPRVAGFVSSVEWLRSALDRPARASDDGGGGAVAARAMETARTLLAFFTEQRDRVALRDMEEYFPGSTREDLCAGVRLGVQRCLFFLGLRHADLEVLVGIWPAAARRLRRLAVVLAPEPVAVDQVFGHPFLVEDMTTLLIASRGQPIPIRRGDDKPFARYVEDASGALLTLPPWLEAMTGLTLDSRIALALQALRVTGLLGVPGAAAAPLLPAPGADQWIRRPIEERTRLVVERLGEGDGRPRLLALLEEDRLFDGDRQGEIFPWLAQAFGSVPVSSCIRFADFAEYQAAIGSPLGASAEPADGREPHGTSFTSEEAMEELWKSFLGVFLGRCLLSLGGAEAGLAADGRPGFRMTEAGLGLLGAGAPPRSSADHGGAAAEAPLIVQPNFEIVFLAPSPAAEAELGRFCERIGREIGVLFRISRQSLQRAGIAGMGAEEVISLLARRSRNPLPANVQHEIRGWGSAGGLS
jgi:hypothetical protein